MTDRSRRLIERLDLAPHSEGGFYKELFRSPSHVETTDGRSPRSAVTTIYYMLVEGQFSRWHRVRSDEIWHFYEGDPLELFVAPPALDRVERVVLGPSDGEGCYVYTVPADWWQAARPLGAFTLAGCTVAPGFEFADFSVVPDDPSAMRALERLSADMRGLV
jgi:predicted cupin superfamily sugar epimerase